MTRITTKVAIKKFTLRIHVCSTPPPCVGPAFLLSVRGGEISAVCVHLFLRCADYTFLVVGYGWDVTYAGTGGGNTTGPGVVIAPGDEFSSLSVRTVLQDTNDLERQGMGVRKTMMALAPSLMENPLIWMVTDITGYPNPSAPLRLAVSQAAATGEWTATAVRFHYLALTALRQGTSCLSLASVLLGTAASATRKCSTLHGYVSKDPQPLAVCQASLGRLKRT